MKYEETDTGFVMSIETADEHFGKCLERGDTVDFDGHSYKCLGILVGQYVFVAK
jgi:hypothetical protein